MTAEVPEIKLVKLLTIALTEKYTDDATWCWSNIYCLLQKRKSVTTKILFKLSGTGVKEKKQADEVLFCFLNFIFHQLLIKYNSITNFYPAFSTPFRIPGWWCHTFLQERIQKSNPRAGRAQKDVFPFTREKNEGRVQKNKK